MCSCAQWCDNDELCTDMLKEWTEHNFLQLLPNNRKKVKHVLGAAERKQGITSADQSWGGRNIKILKSLKRQKSPENLLLTQNVREID